MKVITLGCAEQERRQILIELRTLHKSDVPGIISFMDAFYADNAVRVSVRGPYLFENLLTLHPSTPHSLTP
eukprot:5959070-Prymnesium_polylepis.1